MVGWQGLTLEGRRPAVTTRIYAPSVGPCVPWADRGNQINKMALVTKHCPLSSFVTVILSLLRKNEIYLISFGGALGG